MRTFISLNIDGATKEKVSDIQTSVIQNISLANEKLLDSIKWESKDKFHITLFFIGDVNKEKLKAIDNALSEIGSQLNFEELRFRTAGINAFPNLRYPRVIILDLINEDKNVFKLSERINRELEKIGFSKGKQFHPHITLGRVKREKKLNLTELKNIRIPDINFLEESLFLMESKLNSKDSEYSVVKKYMFFG
ncbi:MAG: RNA 2',3'-cyclic phosphodiesterase [Bacteroidota bacterium]|nr:RNA 2',3'-cyclic phosphodiesterase [Bacteroidota bacterium]